jgi:hypothetical protein
MEPLDKLKVVIQGMIKQRKKEIDRGKASGMHPAFPYVNGMEHEIAMLELVLCHIDAIKRNVPSLFDEMK